MVIEYVTLFLEGLSPFQAALKSQSLDSMLQ